MYTLDTTMHVTKSRRSELKELKRMFNTSGLIVNLEQTKTSRGASLVYQ